ncbi:MAG: spermidine/putrescine ABC transporter substrate-binding protein [Anaerolineaceae bacterium]|nr:spermidine/putrescine ABC transporter substrate-binding protein [Anaerolineaceae bacterium]
MNNRFFVLLIVGLLLVALVAPVAAQDSEMATTWTCPEGFAGQQLNVYNWSTYIAEDTISNFEKLCGVTVTYDTFESSEAAVARLRAGNPGYDIVVPAGSDIPRLIEENLLVPLDMSLIPNFANITPELTGTPFDPNNEYALGYQWGTIGIGYNTTKVSEEITTWDQMFNYPDPTVAWLEDRRGMLATAALILGYDPNTKDPDEVQAITDYLIEHGSNVIYIAGDDGQELLARGEADIVVEYSGDIFQIIDECECDDYVYVIPAEGANIWMDMMAIPAGAQNVPLAHAFLDYILDPQAGADISNYTAYASPNQAAIDQGLIDPELLDNPAIYPDAELLQRLYWIQPNIESEQLYNDAWDEIKIRIGQ